MNELNWFLENIGKRIYKVSGSKKDLEAKDGIYVTSRMHAMRLYLGSRNSDVKYSTEKRWY